MGLDEQWGIWSLKPRGEPSAVSSHKEPTEEKLLQHREAVGWRGFCWLRTRSWMRRNSPVQQGQAVF